MTFSGCSTRLSYVVAAKRLMDPRRLDEGNTLFVFASGALSQSKGSRGLQPEGNPGLPFRMWLRRVQHVSTTSTRPWANWTCHIARLARQSSSLMGQRGWSQVSSTTSPQPPTNALFAKSR